MILSRFRSTSSASCSWSMLDADDAPQSCISISAKRFSSSHCCCDSFEFSALFSASTVCRRSRSLLISSSKASWEPSSGTPALDRWVRESQMWWPWKEKDYSIDVWIPQKADSPLRLGCDCGRDVCDIVRLRGRSSELGLREPGVSADVFCRSDAGSSRVDRGLGALLQIGLEINR